MIDARVPRDIRSYDTKLVGNMNFRQIICFTIAGALDAILIFSIIMPMGIGMEYIAYILIFVDVPILAFAYLKPGGMKLEEYIKDVTLRSFLTPKWRKSQNIIYEEKYPPYQLTKRDRKRLKSLQRQNKDFIPYR